MEFRVVEFRVAEFWVLDSLGVGSQELRSLGWTLWDVKGEPGEEGRPGIRCAPTARVGWCRVGTGRP